MEKNIIEVIIERLEKEHGDNGIYYLLKTWYEAYEAYGFEECYNMEKWEINGFIWGLEAVGYITTEESREARKYILENQKGNR